MEHSTSSLSGVLKFALAALTVLACSSAPAQWLGQLQATGLNPAQLWSTLAPAALDAMRARYREGRAAAPVQRHDPGYQLP